MYMYKEDSALDILQWLMWHKTKPTNQPTNLFLHIVLVLY